MSSTSVMRVALVLTGVFNFWGAAMFAFPETLGRAAALPLPASVFSGWNLAALIAIFGAIYLWLAFRKQIDRSIIFVAALDKFSFFAVTIACWLSGHVSAPTVVPAVGDLLFSLVFTWWLLVTRDRSGTWPRS